MKEQWKEITGFKGRYQVSDLGRVRSFVVPGRGTDASSRARARILKLPANTNGYLQVHLRGSRGEKMAALVHRLVVAAFLGPIPPGRYVHHRDGNKGNNRLDNLQLVSPAVNNKLALDEGRRLMPCGTNHHDAKLTEDDVRAMRASYVEGSNTHGYAGLAQKYGVGAMTIWKAVNRKTWRHVE